MRILLNAFILGFLIGCTSSTPAAPCSEPLFGLPNAMTGLTNVQCQPQCSCADPPFVAATFPASRVAALRAWVLSNPPAALTSDPYQSPAPTFDANAVCAVVPADATHYALQNFPSATAATAQGGIVTHYGVCGLCSTLADLAVYASIPDLTAPVRTCGIQHTDYAGLLACIAALGFTQPCAQIWTYNTMNTRQVCETICLQELTAPYNLPDGGLNPCLECDEEMSGPVFAAVAGRTRRNTGIASAICRPCSEVRAINHVYQAP